ncbi:hypothetical protein [Alteribacter aurantiacus]|uniref:hypothetical protein n=1 Tax=Alteribacter aurantiacus TaxID=254410 RepID=UPI000424AC2B|nr:hypothetical protein [Alteribacter aurantiacus]
MTGWSLFFTIVSASFFVFFLATFILELKKRKEDPARDKWSLTLSGSMAAVATVFLILRFF